MRVKRIYHHFEKCEEYKSNMWKPCPPVERDKYIAEAAALMIAHDDFYAAMMQAVTDWPRSCEANLTASSINHQAWLGHAGCAIAVGSPEDMTRLAWRTLTQEQQDLANAAADKAIANWREQHIKNLMEKKNA